MIKVKVNSATKGQLKEVAHLHRQVLERSFLANLGTRFLSLMYGSIQQYPKGFLIVAEQNGEVAGFVTGVEEIGGFYKWFIRKKFFKGAWRILPHLFSFSKLRRIMETLLYPAKTKNQDYPSAELLTLGVGLNYRRMGVAAALFHGLEEEFRKREVTKFKIVVGQQLGEANKFYPKMGAEVITTFEMHSGETSFLYLRTLV